MLDSKIAQEVHKFHDIVNEIVHKQKIPENYAKMLAYLRLTPGFSSENEANYVKYIRATNP